MSHETISKVASDATFAGATISAAAAAPHYVFGLSMDEWSVIGILFGMAMAFAGLLTNFWFKRAHLKLAEARAIREFLDGDEDD